MVESHSSPLLKFQYEMSHLHSQEAENNMSITLTLGKNAKNRPAPKPLKPLALNKKFRRLYLFRKTSRWVAARETKIAAFYLIQKANYFRLFLIGKGEAYDFDLAEEMGAFSRGLPRSVRIVATLIPASNAEEIRGFFDPKSAFASGEVVPNAES